MFAIFAILVAERNHVEGEGSEEVRRLMLLVSEAILMIWGSLSNWIITYITMIKKLK